MKKFKKGVGLKRSAAHSLDMIFRLIRSVFKFLSFNYFQAVFLRLLSLNCFIQLLLFHSMSVFFRFCL